MSASARPFEPQRRLIVQVRWGPLAGNKSIVLSGQTLRVGRAESAGLSISGDSALSEFHFELSWDGEKCRLRDLHSVTGTLLNGELQVEGDVPHGAWVRAGATDFFVYREAETPLRQPEKPEQAGMVACKDRALALLRSQTEPLLAVLDSARDSRILVLLRESVEECRSLYEGAQGEVLEDVAPYLVRLPRESRLLEALVQEGWGNHWGIFLTSRRPFNEVRRHLRKFLMVQDHAGQELYFRFYDPRVLRIFLTACIPEQTQALFEGVSSYWVEGQQPEFLIRFMMLECSAYSEAVPLGTG